MSYEDMTPTDITVTFDFDKDDKAAPTGISVEDSFRRTESAPTWRVNHVRVVIKSDSDDLDVTASGMRLLKSGKTDGRQVFSNPVRLSGEDQLAFATAAMKSIRL